MFLGIEIGGTKLQLGVGLGDGSPFVELQRFDVEPGRASSGILERIEDAGTTLKSKHGFTVIGIGFGGPVVTGTGRTIKSHQVDGWIDFPLAQWCQRTLGLPTVLANDCDSAGLAEARFGAGQGARVVFYVTVGSGIGGGLVVDGQVYHGAGSAAAEIGHLRPGLHADRPEETVEAIASGWGIAAAAQARLAEPISHQLKPVQDGIRSLNPEEVRQRLIEVEEAKEEFAADLLQRCEGRVDGLTAKHVTQAAADGNEIAREVLGHACQALGWAIAQTITLLSPDVVVMGGGVSQTGDALFLSPLAKEVRRYVFPPLVDTYRILPARLGEASVVHGALALARERV